MLVLMLMSVTTSVSFASDGPKTTKESVIKEKVNAVVTVNAENVIAYDLNRNANYDVLIDNEVKSNFVSIKSYANTGKNETIKFLDRYRLTKFNYAILNYKMPIIKTYFSNVKIYTKRNC